jgi:hypothetical protein
VRAYTVIDIEDLDIVRHWRWCLSGGYAARRDRSDSEPKSIRLHREIVGLQHGDTREVDHIDRDTLNNRRSNLRIVNRAGNMQNSSSRRGSTSPYLGVSWHKPNGMWRAQIAVNGKKIHLGDFADEQQAARVAREARLHFHPFAVN